MNFPFDEYQKRAKRMTIPELEYAKADAYEAAEALRGAPTMGKDEGWYMDEFWTYSDELRRRKQ